MKGSESPYGISKDRLELLLPLDGHANYSKCYGTLESAVSGLRNLYRPLSKSMAKILEPLKPSEILGLGIAVDIAGNDLNGYMRFKDEYPLLQPELEGLLSFAEMKIFSAVNPASKRLRDVRAAEDKPTQESNSRRAPKRKDAQNKPLYQRIPSVPFEAIDEMLAQYSPKKLNAEGSQLKRNAAIEAAFVLLKNMASGKLSTA